LLRKSKERGIMWTRNVPHFHLRLSPVSRSASIPSTPTPKSILDGESKQIVGDDVSRIVNNSRNRSPVKVGRWWRGRDSSALCQLNLIIHKGGSDWPEVQFDKETNHPGGGTTKSNHSIQPFHPAPPTDDQRLIFYSSNAVSLLLGGCWAVERLISWNYSKPKGRIWEYPNWLAREKDIHILSHSPACCVIRPWIKHKDRSNGRRTQTIPLEHVITTFSTKSTEDIQNSAPFPTFSVKFIINSTKNLPYVLLLPIIKWYPKGLSSHSRLHHPSSLTKNTSSHVMYQFPYN